MLDLDMLDIVDVDTLSLNMAGEVSMKQSDRKVMAADEALALCVNTKGRVDLPYMIRLSGLPEQDLVNSLGGAIFQDPEGYALHQNENEDWLLREQYLSGNVKHKLNAARKLDRKYHRFAANIAALESALPDRPDIEEIGICLGSPWIPTQIYRAFAKQILGLTMEPKIFYSTQLHKWKVNPPAARYHTIQNMYEYGTYHMPALKIIEMTLNSQTAKVYETVSRPDRKTGTVQILNKQATIVVQEKQAALQGAFQIWINQDKQRMKHLEEIYYDTYSCNMASRFDGDLLTLPDLNPDITLYPHQRSAVAHIILGRDVLLNHAVGSGKTFEIIAGIHERKRMGLSPKNMVVVPNNVLDAFADAHRLLYPQDAVLVIYPKDFTPGKRTAVLEQIRDGSHVAIYMAYSSFDQIHMSKRYYLDKQEKAIRSARAAAGTAGTIWECRALNKLADKGSKKLLELMEKLPEDRGPAFDDLGITTLAVDEAHNYKNISLNSRTDGVAGMHAKGSKHCDEMLDKADFTRSQGDSVIFATGTPLSNSIADLYVLQRYLQPEQLALLHLDRFDQWVNSFCQCQTGFEIDADSQSFRIMTRFSRFYNLPELTNLFANVCNFYSGENSGIGLPHCAGPIDVVVPISSAQKDYYGDLVLRAELIRAKLVLSDEDNMLKVTHDGRAAAMDIRLVEPDRRPDRQGTKAFTCAEKVLMHYHRHPNTAQLVFCDIGTPKKDFNLYDELRDILVELGIPRQEIAYIHDADTETKRRRLFEAANEAKVRVLLGSTAKLGTGVNVQKRLIAIHHLDVPWKPSDMTQREGRILRQGNSNSEVYIYRYITAGTFDSYSWQIVENKQRFISQFMANTLAEREARDLSDVVLSYAEVKALAIGDPLLKTRVETANLLERAKVQQRQRDQELASLRTVIAQTPIRLEELKERRTRLELDLRHFDAHREELDRADRIMFGEELLEALSANSNQAAPRRFDTIHGFQVWLPGKMDAAAPYVEAVGESGNRYIVDMKGAKPMGCVQRIEYLLRHLGERIEGVQTEVENIHKRCAETENAVLNGNPFHKEVTQLTIELARIDEELARHMDDTATGNREENA